MISTPWKRRNARRTGDTELRIWEHLADLSRVGGVENFGFAQMSLSLGGLLREDVTSEGMAAFDLSGARHLESLARPPVRLQFVHASRLLFLPRCEYRDEVVAFHLGPVLHPPDVVELVHQPFDQRTSNLLVNDFTSPEPDVRLNFIPLL